MIGFLGSVVGPAAKSIPVSDCPRHIPADNRRKPARDLEIIVLLGDDRDGKTLVRTRKSRWSPPNAKRFV
jgi:hypothetical protein